MKEYKVCCRWSEQKSLVQSFLVIGDIFFSLRIGAPLPDALLKSFASFFWKNQKRSISGAYFKICQLFFCGRIGRGRTGCRILFRKTKRERPQPAILKAEEHMKRKFPRLHIWAAVRNAIQCQSTVWSGKLVSLSQQSLALFKHLEKKEYNAFLNNSDNITVLFFLESPLSRS